MAKHAGLSNNPCPHTNAEPLLVSTQYSCSCNSQIKCFWTRVDMEICSYFGMWNSCPKFVRICNLQFVYIYNSLCLKKLEEHLFWFHSFACGVESDATKILIQLLQSPLSVKCIVTGVCFHSKQCSALPTVWAWFVPFLKQTHAHCSLRQQTLWARIKFRSMENHILSFWFILTTRKLNSVTWQYRCKLRIEKHVEGSAGDLISFWWIVTA
jgi:hypothetical protein